MKEDIVMSLLRQVQSGEIGVEHVPVPSQPHGARVLQTSQLRQSPGRNCLSIGRQRGTLLSRGLAT